MASKARREIDLIHLIEKNFPVEELVYKDVNWWPVLRVHLGKSLWFEKESDISGVSRLGYFKRFYSSIKLIFGALKHYLVNGLSTNKKFAKYSNLQYQVKNPDILSFSIPGQTTEKIGGKSFNQYIDSILEDAKSSYSSCAIQVVKSDFHFSEFHTPSKIISDDPKMFHIRSWTFNLIKDLCFIEKSELPKIFYEFCNFVNIKCKCTAIECNSIYKLIQSILITKRYIKRIIGTKNPKVILITGYYSPFLYSVILASKELGIPTADCQHGVQGSIHWAYANWGKMKENGYKLLPSWFLVYTERELIHLNSSLRGSNRHKVAVIGNKWKKVSLEYTQKKQEIYFKCFSSNKLNVLYSHHEGLLSDYLLGFIRDTQNEYNWLFRYHPRCVEEYSDYDESFKRLGIINFDSYNPTNINLFHLLNKTDVHISCASSVVIDALEFGMKSIIASEEGKEMFYDYIEDDEIIFCESKEQIDKCVKNENLKIHLKGSEKSSVEILGKIIKSGS
jgi:hypothetical protein